MPRFVVLRHETPPGYERPLHWDFMLEAGSVLRTWALPMEPHECRGAEAEALPDHRLAYLEYEGPVSPNRGDVTRWDRGDYEIVAESDSELTVRLRGSRLTGTATLSRGGDPQRWRFSFSAEGREATGSSQ